MTYFANHIVYNVLYLFKHEGNIMTANELKLIDLIRNHPDAEKAFDIALKIIIEHLEQAQSSEEPSPVCSRESA